MDSFFAALVGALVGGGFALLGTHIATVRQAKQALTDFRLAGKADAYVDISDFVVRLRAAVQVASPERTQDLDELAARIGDDRWWQIQAKAEAFGSQDVRDRFEDLLGLRIRVRNHLGDWETVLAMRPEERTSDYEIFLDAYREARTDALVQCRSVLEAINSELSGVRESSA